MRKLLLILVSIAPGLMLRTQAQTPNDALMMPKNTLCTGFLYGHDQWKNYWEGSLKRDNLNIGTLTTQSAMWYGIYGVNSKLNVIGMLPYVWTKASGGTLHGMQGVQDLTLAAKYHVMKAEAGAGKFSTFVTGSFSTPMTDYTPDFLPLSIGLATTNLSGRAIFNYQMNNGLYATGSAAYTWRSNTKLDRPTYFTDGTYYSTNEVWMPNVFDYTVNVGYRKKAFQTDVFYTQQSTLGGGDIRRQDMPFASNKMNFSKVGALVMYYVPFPKNVAVRATANYTVAGRNVGQSFSYMAGVMYTFYFDKNKEN